MRIQVRGSFRWLGLLGVALSFGWSTEAAAQDDESTATAASELDCSGERERTGPCLVRRAEEEFLRGDEALNELRFGDARDSFELSQELYPDRGTAYNLGQAYRGTGQFVEAKAIWTQLLEGEFGELSSEQGQDVAAALEEIDDWPVRLCVTVVGPARARLTLGDVEAEGLAGVPTCRDVNPGRLVVRVDADGYVADERRLSLPRSGNESLTLAPAPVERTSSTMAPGAGGCGRS